MISLGIDESNQGVKWKSKIHQPWTFLCQIKQVVHHNLALDVVPIGVVSHAKCGHHGLVQRLPCLAVMAERRHAVAHVFVIILRDDIFLVGKLHLAKVDDPILAVNQKIDLPALPCCAIIVGIRPREP